MSVIYNYMRFTCVWVSGFSLVLLLGSGSGRSRGSGAAGQQGMIVRVRKTMPLSVYLGHGS